VSLRLGFGSDAFTYAIDPGLPSGPNGAFSLDPEIKHETIWHGATLRPSVGDDGGAAWRWPKR